MLESDTATHRLNQSLADTVHDRYGDGIGVSGVATKFSQYRRPEAASIEQRAEPRLRLSLTHASVRRHGKAAIDAMLHDLSVYGCRMEAQTGAVAGERLWLRFESRSPVAATVVWNSDGMIGCRFETPIERSMMRSLTLRLA